MQALNSIDDKDLLEQVGDRWPSMTRALKIYSDPKRCQENYQLAKKLLMQYVEKNGVVK